MEYPSALITNAFTAKLGSDAAILNLSISSFQRISINSFSFSRTSPISFHHKIHSSNHSIQQKNE